MTEPACELAAVPTLAALLEREAAEPGRSLPSDIRVPSRLLDRALFEPLRAVARRPGKELRGRLVGVAYQLCGGDGAVAPELSAALEALHLGSLVVDDIEDGSLHRRGDATLHRLVGVPLALNAGNWLYFYPTVLLSRAGLAPRIELSLRVAIDRGVLRCHYGQALDLSVRITELRQREVPELVAATTRLKTGSLLELAAEVGALAADAAAHEVAALARLGCELGVALQMLDDLTGLTSPRRSHKGHEDLLDARPSWVWSWLAEREDDVGYRRLRALAEQVTQREVEPAVLAAQLRERIAEPGAEAVRRKLRNALAQVEPGFGGRRAFKELASEVERLERYDG
ncbi:MAG TPA: polyprenyl synthetase family protein [Polyangiaceae bacterium]|jgi:geranylgeranyl pyrophosphate synthase|nr:polyprenyl synthetase family protein [Polyangiaceae bacterium]